MEEMETFSTVVLPKSDGVRNLNEKQPLCAFIRVRLFRLFRL